MQMDFTAYYTAGKVMNLGLTPYKNYIIENWNLWDGVAQFKHSRFLYPPIIGSFFQLFAELNYHSAKHLWNYLNLFFVLGAVYLWLRISKLDKNIFVVLITGVFTLNFFPFYTLLERGQIDGLTFLFLTLTIFFLINKKDITSGIFLALASIFKLYSLLLIPFLVFKKQYKAAVFSAVSFSAIIILMYAVNGKEEVNDYILNQTPRISQYAESGTEDMKIDSWILKNYFPMTKYSITIIEQRLYVSESISFFSKASLVKVIDSVQKKMGLNLSNSLWSLIFLALVSFIFIRNAKHYSEFHFWVTLIVIILLCSPFTWVMNLVWLIPVVLILIKLIQDNEHKNYIFGLILTGLILITIPDNYKVNNFILDNLMKIRYIIGEILILTGMLLLPKIKGREFSEL